MPQRFGKCAFEATGKQLPLQVLKHLRLPVFFIGTAVDGKLVSRESLETYGSQELAEGALTSGSWHQIEVLPPLRTDGRKGLWFLDLNEAGISYPTRTSVEHYLPQGGRVKCSSTPGQCTEPELDDLRVLWGELSDVPVDEQDCLDQRFLHFAKGTSREDVWHWFEEQHPAFVVGEEMSGRQHLGADVGRERSAPRS